MLDGIHRLLKADLAGRQLIETKQVRSDCIGMIACSAGPPAFEGEQL